MAKRNDIAPYERREARRWTRVTDYVADADAHVWNVHWPKPGTLGPTAVFGHRDESEKRGRRGLWPPVIAVALAALIGLWGSGLLRPAGAPRNAAVSTSRGLTFGLCDQGGLTNCVASGDSFYLGGKTIRIANIEAPQLYGAACPREAELGAIAAKRLQSMLNSGEIRMSRIGQDVERYGLLLRNVAVNGSDVGQAMIEAGLAREIGDLTRSWC